MLDAINRRLSIGLRLAMVGVLVVVSFGICSGIFLTNGLQALEFSKQELQGLKYIDATWDAMRNDRNKLPAWHRDLDRKYKTENRFQLFSEAVGQKPFDTAASLLIWWVGGGSGLSQDPDPGSFYIAEVLVKRLAQQQTDLNALSAAVASEESASRATKINAAAAKLKSDQIKMNDSYSSAFDWDKSGYIKTHLSSTRNGLQEMAAVLEDAAHATVSGDPKAIRIYKKAEEIYRAGLGVGWQVTSRQLGILLNNRIDSSWEKTLFQLGFILLFVVLTLALLVIVTLGLSKRFRELDHAMNLLNRGDKSVDVPYLEDTNETGRIAQTLAHMKESLIQKEKDSAQRRADREAAEAAQRAAEEEAQRRSEELVVSTFGEGLLALASDDLDFRLEADVPAAYRGLKENFNIAIAKFEQNRRDREAAAKQREADRLHAEEARKEAEEAARQNSVALVVSSFGAGLRALAERDLTFSLNMQLPEDYAGLQADFNSAMRQLCDVMRDIDGRASDISSNCMEISKSSKDMAQRTERQAAALEQTSAAVTELTSTVAKSAESAVEASSKAGGAKTEAEHGNAIVLDAISAMRGIAKSSGEMSQIISAIDEIAFQTNLLALNAGVEAARAGDAGRGFAVVASEVRALAGRSAEAAHQIKSLIKSSEEQVAGGVKLVEESGAALARIVENISTITSLMSELASSQREQATALSEIDSAISDMDRVTQQNAAMAEESNAASENLAGHANNMAGLVAQFKVKV